LFDQERAWYDNHREAILRGGLGEKVEEEGIDLFQYFSTSCYSGPIHAYMFPLSHSASAVP
jgi:hypothetical protein